MTDLIDDVLDLARGRLGGGLALDRRVQAPLRPALEQVVEELRAAWPGREIKTSFHLNQGVAGDSSRMAQLFSNLLSNALTHGAADRPVLVRAATEAGLFELSVANQGDPIADETMKRLFQPFFRSPTQAAHQGLGLGLYIASEIARAHGATLVMASSPEETRFTLHMPLG